jgi:hypothetical protein
MAQKKQEPAGAEPRDATHLGGSADAEGKGYEAESPSCGTQDDGTRQTRIAGRMLPGDEREDGSIWVRLVRPVPGTGRRRVSVEIDAAVVARLKLAAFAGRVAGKGVRTQSEIVEAALRRYFDLQPNHP